MSFIQVDNLIWVRAYVHSNQAEKEVKGINISV